MFCWLYLRHRSVPKFAPVSCFFSSTKTTFLYFIEVMLHDILSCPVARIARLSKQLTSILGMLKKWMPVMLKMPNGSLYFSLINKLLIELNVVLHPEGQGCLLELHLCYAFFSQPFNFKISYWLCVLLM